VSLSASATDPDRDPLSYQWLVRNEPDGANAVLTARGSATTPATGLTASGEYVFAVTIHDGVNSVTRNVVLNVHADNEPLFPFDVHNRLPVTMTLPINNTELRCAAIDLEGDPLTYRWSVLSQPAVAAALLASPAAAACPVTNMTVPGDYVFQVKLSDPSHTVAEKLIVTVDPPNPSAPTIMDAAAAPATLTLAVAATRLSATSRDPDGSHAGSDGITLETLYEDLTVGDVSYWSIVGLGGPGPGGSSISISTTPPSAGAAPIGSTAKLLIFS
jgi:hypothetical protein